MTRPRASCDDQFVAAKALLDDYEARIVHTHAALQSYIAAANAANAHAATAIRTLAATVLPADAPYKAVADDVLAAHSALTNADLRAAVRVRINSALQTLAAEIADCESLQRQMTQRESSRAECEYYQQKWERLNAVAQSAPPTPLMAERMQRNQVKLLSAQRHFAAINGAVIVEMSNKWARRLTAVAPAMRDIVETERAIVAQWTKLTQECPAVDVDALNAQYNHSENKRLPLITTPHQYQYNEQDANANANANVNVNGAYEANLKTEPTAAPQLNTPQSAIVEDPSSAVIPNAATATDIAPYEAEVKYSEAISGADDNIVVHTVAATTTPASAPSDVSSSAADTRREAPPLPPRPKSISVVQKNAVVKDDTPLTPSPPHRTVDDTHINSKIHDAALRPAPVAMPLANNIQAITLSDLLFKGKQQQQVQEQQTNETARDTTAYETDSAKSKRVHFQ